MANKEIQQEVEDLKAATALISEGVTTLQTNLLTASNKIAELEQAGVSPETIAQLRAAVDGAQTIAQQFEKAADSEQPTPDASELPQPVETVGGEEAPAGGETATGDDQATPAPAEGTEQSGGDNAASDETSNS